METASIQEDLNHNYSYDARKRTKVMTNKVLSPYDHNHFFIKFTRLKPSLFTKVTMSAFT